MRVLRRRPALPAEPSEVADQGDLDELPETEAGIEPGPELDAEPVLAEPEKIGVYGTDTGITIVAMDGTRYSATMSFPIPMAQRTCADGPHPRALPTALVIDGAGVKTDWFPGGDNGLPREVDEEVHAYFLNVIRWEHTIAEHNGMLPVLESVIDTYRAVDPGAGVEQIRAADAAFNAMAGEPWASREIALWVGRGYVPADEHRVKVRSLESTVRDLRSREPEDAPPMSPREERVREERSRRGIMEILNMLCSQGRKVPDNRAGPDDVHAADTRLDAA
ncbi:hypothetical protein [Arthrobacter caoxuetaonis]|uniref:Uncharacterized protein n=1 Tax=Arthrobacter caoxuetaonis TaxID=2886935 RepID=A0A9X1SGH1_9MICC|nr:hypothetical protein [Arthrobacter caoxuetaonis]MCC3299369.1 hypothetical protein [Arthrobacter caoxuetaonis]USQ59138.1 hypothetical protein NF551_18705 [Arthrobacter caoxuetaonis]